MSTLSSLSSSLKTPEKCNICFDSIYDDGALLAVHLASDGQDGQIAHIFHRNCVAPWLRTNSTCPTCRGSWSSLEIESTQAARGQALLQILEQRATANQIDEILQLGDISDTDRAQAIFLAIYRKEFLNVEKLLQSGTISDTDRGRAVSFAAARGDFISCQKLLQSGNVSEGDRLIALALAAARLFPAAYIAADLPDRHRFARLINQDFIPWRDLLSPGAHNMQFDGEATLHLQTAAGRNWSVRLGNYSHQGERITVSGHLLRPIRAIATIARFVFRGLGALVRRIPVPYRI